MFRALTSYFTKEVQKEVKPESYAETAGQPSTMWMNRNTQKNQIEKFINIYEQGGMISEAIDLYPLFMFSKGYSFEGDPKAIDACKSFIDGFDFDQAFNMAVTCPLVCGDGYQEILRGRARNPLGLLYRNPSSFTVTYDQYGMVGYC